jgi:hypothetical protein
MKRVWAGALKVGTVVLWTVLIAAVLALWIVWAATGAR